MGKKGLISILSTKIQTERYERNFFRFGFFYEHKLACPEVYK